MSKLFIRPNQVVERLRDRFAYIQSKVPQFPTVKVVAATDSDLSEYLADSDATLPSSTTIYVGGGLSVGEVPAAAFETNVTTGITLILAIGTADEHAKIADELAIYIKEAVFISLHMWNWDDNRTPLYFVTDSIIKVKGNAVLIRAYEFAHEVLTSYDDIDDAFDLFDNLPDFLSLKTDHEFCTAPDSDIAEFESNVEFDGFNVSLTFNTGVNLDPALVGGDNVRWIGPSEQVSTGTTPTPSLNEAGRWALVIDDYLAVTQMAADSDGLTEIGNIDKLTSLQTLNVETNSLTSLDLSTMESLISLQAQNNPSLDVDTIVDAIYANKDEIPVGGSYNIGGTCPAVSAGSAAKITELEAAPYNHTWTNN